MNHDAVHWSSLHMVSVVSENVASCTTMESCLGYAENVHDWNSLRVTEEKTYPEFPKRDDLG